MNNIRETTIERTIRENTPDFVVGTSHFVEKYHSFKWQCPVHFADGVYVSKGIDGKNGLELKQYDMAYPDFVLLDEKQCRSLDKTVYNADNGLDYSNPFLRNHGWYIEAFGDYWHSKSITGMNELEHEKEVVRAYESSGNHVLVLWEHDIKNHWYEVCVPKINEFIGRFKRECLCDDAYAHHENVQSLSDDAIACLNDNEYYRSIDDKESIVDELCEFYHSRILPYYNRNMIDVDLNNVKRKYEGATMYTYSSDGRMMLDYFFRSRMDDCCKNSRSINDIWHDMTLMRRAISKCFDDGRKVVSSSVVLNEMIDMNGYSVPRDLSFWHTLSRLKRFSTEGGIFFDPYAGYGERLVASWLMGMKYIGIASGKKNESELNALSDYLGSDVEIFRGNVADAVFLKGVLKGRKIDLCFTFPNRFGDVVKQDDEFGFSSFDDWKENWLVPMMANCNAEMSDNGRFIVSMPPDFDWSCVNGINVSGIDYYGFNEKVENPYFSIGKACTVEGDDYVRCAICGECMRQLSNHVMKVHGMSAREYEEKYGVQTTSKVAFDAKAEANKRKYSGIDNHHYSKRYVYLLPDGSYASKSDKYKRVWGVDEIKPEHIIDASTIDYVPDYAKNISGEEGEDYVRCVICGEKKGSLTQHLRKVHNMTSEQYSQMYGAPVHSRKNEEAFHQCAVNKWQTQFESGAYQRAKPREKVENPITRKRDDITADVMKRMMDEGYTQIEMCKELKCSDTTFRKWMNECGLEMPSRTVTAIRKAVKGGALLNLETTPISDVQKMISEIGIERTMDRFGVKRTVFDTWMEEHKEVKEQDKVEEPVFDSTGQLVLFGDAPVSNVKDDIPTGLDDNGVADFLKSHGFPYPNVNDYDAERTVAGIKNSRSIFDAEGNIQTGFSYGNDILLSLFPNFFEARQHGKKSAMWHFENNLEHILNDIRKHSNRYPTLALVRSYLVEHERVSGFRPTVAKQIYDKYCPENAIVLDPCGGWGGRMLGAYCSDRVKRYDCIDACKKTCEGLERVKDTFGKIVMGKDVNVKFGAFEDVCVEDEFYDFVFTSTPYFIKEHYSDDEEESCNRYEKYEEWRNGFLKPFVEKSFKCLKNGGVFAVNIDDVVINHKKYDLCDDLKKLAEGTGFVFKERLFMKSRNRYVGTQSGEPIFVMIKEAK